MTIEHLLYGLSIALALVLIFKLWSGFTKTKKIDHQSSQNQYVENEEVSHNQSKAGTESIFQSPSGSVFYRTIGDKSLPPLLLVHGIGSSEYCWRNNTKTLSEKYFLILPDLLGFGKSEKKLSDDFNYENHEEALLGLLDYLKVEKCPLVSCSMGGAISLWIASRHPHRFSKIVAIAPAASPEIVPSWARDLKSLTGLSTSLIGNQFIGKNFIKYLMNEIYANKSIVHPSSIQTYLKPYLSKESHRAFSHHLKLLGQKEAFEALSKVQNEVLVVLGDSDKIVSRNILNQVLKNIPTARFEVIIGAGHHPMEENPLAFNKLIQLFLK